MLPGMCRLHFPGTVCDNLTALIVVRKVIVYFVYKIIFALIKDKVFTGNKIIKKIFLLIAQKKTAASHDIHTAKRYAGVNATQRDI